LQDFFFEDVYVGITESFIIVLLGSHSSLFCWDQELGIHFLHFPMNPVLNHFLEESGFHSFFFFPSLHLVLCHYVLDSLVGDFKCLFSFTEFNFCVVTALVVS
jgi:hypothetical protein